MNLPLAKLNRDELYTFIIGIFTASAWHQHFQQIGFIATNTGVIDPTLVLAWLFATGLNFVLYMILIWILDLICTRDIKNENDDAELKKMNLTKNRSFFWAGPLEEERLLLHIYGLITVSLILVYHPVASFLAARPSLSWFIAIHLTYSVITISAYLMLSKTSHYLHRVKNFLDKGYCDTLDQATYIREMASYYAKVKNDIYLYHLKSNRPTEPETRNPPS